MYLSTSVDNHRAWHGKCVLGGGHMQVTPLNEQPVDQPTEYLGLPTKAHAKCDKRVRAASPLEGVAPPPTIALPLPLPCTTRCEGLRKKLLTAVTNESHTDRHTHPLEDPHLPSPPRLGVSAKSMISFSS